MVRKCGFFDCSNPVGEREGRCKSCEDRLLHTCSACRQLATSGREVNLKPSLLKNKYSYKMATIMRDKLPVSLQTKLDQLLPQLKLNAGEQEFISKAEKFLADYLAEKGGKQDHIDWFKLCSDCGSEFEDKGKSFAKQIPQGETTMKSIEEKKGKFTKFFEDNKLLIKSSMSEEEWKKIVEKSEEEFYKQIATNPEPNQRPNKQDQNRPNQNDNNNSAKITQLQQEVNSLKQEIRDLKKPGNPSPANSDTLRNKETKLKEKEKELKELSNKKNPPSSNNQNQTNNNSNLPLIIGGIVGGAGIICLIVALLIAKKKKNNNICLS